MPDILREAELAAQNGEFPRALKIVEGFSIGKRGSAEEKARAYRVAQRILGSQARGRDFLRARDAETALWAWRDEAKAERRAAARAEAKAARVEERAKGLVAAGLPPERVRALASLAAGPHNVEFFGVGEAWNEEEIRKSLLGLGYLRRELTLVLERVIHIGPEVIAYDLHQSEAVRLKVALEDVGARIRISRAT